MYTVRFSKAVDKFIQKHKGDPVFSQFSFAVTKMKFGSIDGLDVKGLKGSPGFYRLRIGKYRFIFEKIESEFIIYFVDAGSRGEIYK